MTAPTPTSRSPLRGPDVTDLHVPLDCHQHNHYRNAPHHEVDFIELRLVLRGRGRLLMGNELFPLHRGQVVVIPAGVVHGCSSGDLGLYDLVLHHAFLRRHAAALSTMPGFAMWFRVEPYFRRETQARYGLTLDPEEHVRMVRLFSLLEEELNLGGETSPPGAEALALFILARLCRAYSRQFPEVSERAFPHRPTLAFQQVLDLVADRYDQKLSLGDLAGAAHMERSYFGRLFRRIMGLTPMQYVHAYRVHIACRLLQETDSDVADVAHAVGYHDGSHFSHTFARVTGLSPSAYRASLQILDYRDTVWDLEGEGGNWPHHA